MSNGRMRVWMWLALGSVLVLGLSAGLLADRLLGERGGKRTEAPAHPQAHAPRPAMFHFDCRAWEESEGAAAADAGGDGQTETAPTDRLSEHSSRATKRLARRLELDPEQIEALAPIVADAMNRSRVYWIGARDEFCAMQGDFHQGMSELLRPEQAERFDEWRSELAERSRRHTNGHRGEHPGNGPESGGCR